jgi:hypothetical protein
MQKRKNLYKISKFSYCIAYKVSGVVTCKQRSFLCWLRRGMLVLIAVHGVLTQCVGTSILLSMHMYYYCNYISLTGSPIMQHWIDCDILHQNNDKSTLFCTQNTQRMILDLHSFWLQGGIRASKVTVKQ